MTLLTLTLAFFTGACTDDKNDSATDATGSSGSGDTTGSEPMSTTGTASTTNPTGTTGGEPGTTGSEPTGGEPSTGELATTGEVPPELLPECQAMCEKAVDCGLAPESEGCALGCSEQYASDTAECAGLVSAYLGCLNDLSCAELFQEGVCADAEAKWQDTCNAVNSCGVGWGGAPDACDLEIDCPEEPLRKMACDTETCTCLVDGQPTGSCAAEAICEDLDALQAKGEACCGF